MLASQRGPGRGRSLQLLEKSVCVSAFRKLLGLGSSRVAKLRKAARQGQPCPLDGRFLTRAKTGLAAKRGFQKRAIIAEFLEELLQTISEPTPENWRKQEGIPQELQLRKPKGRKPMRQVASASSRAKDKSNMRLLPPGTFSDYLKLLNARLEPEQKVSLKLFNADPCHDNTRVHMKLFSNSC